MPANVEIFVHPQAFNHLRDGGESTRLRLGHMALEAKNALEAHENLQGNLGIFADSAGVSVRSASEEQIQNWIDGQEQALDQVTQVVPEDEEQAQGLFKVMNDIEGGLGKARKGLKEAAQIRAVLEEEVRRAFKPAIDDYTVKFLA